jgi:hypothetical protein
LVLRLPGRRVLRRPPACAPRTSSAGSAGARTGGTRAPRLATAASLTRRPAPSFVAQTPPPGGWSADLPSRPAQWVSCGGP